MMTDDLDALKQFAPTRAVLITRRRDGGLQSSPMSVVVDEDGNVLTATRAKSAKVFNLARDSRATVCLFDERWPGPWMQVEGEASIERLPAAMGSLKAYYTQRGQDTSTDAFVQRMQTENRVLITVKTQRVVRPQR
ncbi:MAG: TIGR03618 family F420-dependent PPOX class oxidoreductase [Chloroflexi bacterium]|nr:TIGR03618 family F420-dependent PPOX class oxidoreductase [Chloroflexota bacterium]